MDNEHFSSDGSSDSGYVYHSQYPRGPGGSPEEPETPEIHRYRVRTPKADTAPGRRSASPPPYIHRDPKPSTSARPQVATRDFGRHGTTLPPSIPPLGNGPTASGHQASSPNGASVGAVGSDVDDVGAGPSDRPGGLSSADRLFPQGASLASYASCDKENIGPESVASAHSAVHASFESYNGKQKGRSRACHADINRCSFQRSRQL